MKRALALIDGEHYASVVRDALAELPYDFVGALMLGGTEKLRGNDDYGVPLVTELEDAIAELEPEIVLDLSDEPVLGPQERLRLASRVLARGVPYLGPDFSFEPPPLEPFDLPSLGIVGTGKRVGKTAVAGYIARLLAEDREVVVVAMGRGGPAEPDCIEVQPTVDDLLALSRAGRHAASDYLEDAALAGVVTVGCRRCGGGLAGAVAFSNVSRGAALAARRAPDLVVFEGSGAAFPPIATRKRILVASAEQPADVATGYLNAYRILVSDLVVLTNAEEGSRHEEIRAAIDELKPGLPVVASVLRPRPVDSATGKRVALFTTAPTEAHERLVTHIRQEHGADVVFVSGNLSKRDPLRRDLDRADADVWLVEIKAAAIDVVCEAAAERGVQVIFTDNDVLPLEGEPDLDGELRALADAAVSEPVAG
jgi:cyclic 2,3-diphosphoglycerate synthetase